MRLVGLRFLMEHGMFMNVVVYENEAKEMIDNWRNKQYKMKGTDTIGTTSPPPGGFMWSVDLASVRGVHTFALEEMHRPPLQQGPITTEQVSGVNAPFTPRF